MLINFSRNGQKAESVDSALAVDEVVNLAFKLPSNDDARLLLDYI